MAGRKAGWIDQARVLFDDPAWSQFVGIAYFNAQATNPAYSSCDWRVTTSTSALASFAGMALDPFWSRDVFPNGPVAPTVDFVFSCTDLECTFDSQATDPDGTIVSTQWDFGDGTTASGTATSRTFTAAGTYSVQVTVTDNDGLTGSRAREVTVAESGVSPITFVAQATSNANSTSHRVVVPATVAPGDALIVAVGSNTSAVISSPTGVSGWTSHGGGLENGETLSDIWARWPTPPTRGKTITVTTSTMSKVNMVVAAYRGTSATVPVQVVASAAEDTTRTTHTTPAATVTAAGSQAVWYWTHKDNDTTTMVPPVDVSARSNSSQTGSGRVTGLLADSNGPVPAGTVAGRTATAATASAKATMWTIVLNPS